MRRQQLQSCCTKRSGRGKRRRCEAIDKGTRWVGKQGKLVVNRSSVRYAKTYELVLQITGTDGDGSGGGAATAGGTDAPADTRRVYRTGKAAGARQAPPRTNRIGQPELDAVVGAAGMREDHFGAADCPPHAKRICVL